MRVLTIYYKLLTIMISICVPTYEMNGKAKELLTRSFEMIKKQTYKNFEVIISDNSKDDVVKNLCEDPKYSDLNIKYIRNPKIGMAANTNEAIKQARGELIKILYMDDYLAHIGSLEEMVVNFKGYWLVTGCEHDDGIKRYNKHYPTYNKKIYRGKNTIGSPSVLAIKNEDPLLFDENMTWLLDCDYYERMHETFGEPVILNTINVIIGTGKFQTTHILPNFIKIKEHLYMIKKYKRRLFSFFKLW